MGNDFISEFIPDGMVLEAVTYKDQNTSTVVINTQTVSKYIYIHLPVQCIHLDLLKFSELIKPNDFAKVDECIEPVKRNDILKYMHHPWARFNSSVLNWSPGKHVYKLSFGMPHELEPSYLDYYISYISQEDNPKKEYVYMSR